MKKIEAFSRVCIYAKDIQQITGLSERSARNLLQRIRKFFKKQKHHFITIQEFCDFTGIKKDHTEVR